MQSGHADSVIKASDAFRVCPQAVQLLSLLIGTSSNMTYFPAFGCFEHLLLFLLRLDALSTSYYFYCVGCFEHLLLYLLRLDALSTSCYFYCVGCFEHLLFIKTFYLSLRSLFILTIFMTPAYPGQLFLFDGSGFSFFAAPFKELLRVHGKGVYSKKIQKKIELK